MLVVIGVAVIVAAGFFTGFLLLKKTNGVAVVGFYLVSIVAGIAIANLPHIIKAGYSNKGETIGLEFPRSHGATIHPLAPGGRCARTRRVTIRHYSIFS